MTGSAEALATSLLEQLIPLRRSEASPFLIAIDGPSGVGKSTVAAHLAERLNAAIVEGDDFFAGGTEVHDLGPEALADLCIDRERLHAVLRTLKAGEPASYRPFDWERFDGGLAQEPVTVQPGRTLIVEGVYAFHPDLRDLVDASVLLSAPPAERLRRLMAREGQLTDWERQWHRAEDWYFERLAPPAVFDIVASST